MRILRLIQPFLWVASAVSVAYTAWVFTGRFFEHKKLQQRAVVTGSNPEFDRIYAGNEVKILQFYARDGVLQTGQTTLLCFGVLNATAVRIEPALDGVYPTMNRCLEIAPRQTTAYTLTADGAKGARVTGSVTVRVQ